MDNKISILFYSRIAKKTRQSLIPVYLRITVDGKRLDQSINRTLELSKWSKTAGKMKGTHAEARAFNGYLDTLKNKVHAIERQLVQDGIPVTYESFKDKWLGVHEKPHMLIQIFKQHNEQVKELVGKDFSAATYQRYQTSKLHTQSFIKWKYKVDDIAIKKLNYEFINDYAFWLKSKRDCSHNTTMKYLANFKKVVLLCIKNDWLQKDPFANFKLTKKEVERPFLTGSELQYVASKDFKWRG